MSATNVKVERISLDRSWAVMSADVDTRGVNERGDRNRRMYGLGYDMMGTGAFTVQAVGYTLPSAALVMDMLGRVRGVKF